MAVLSDADRIQVWAGYMRDARLSALGVVTKADLRAAVDALDTWMNDNAATINAAIPQPARGALTQAQKALMLMYVIQQRYLSGS